MTVAILEIVPVDEPDEDAATVNPPVG